MPHVRADITYLRCKAIVVFRCRGLVRTARSADIVTPRVREASRQAFRETVVQPHLKRVVVIGPESSLYVEFSELVTELANSVCHTGGRVSGHAGDQIADGALKLITPLASDVGHRQHGLIRKCLLNGRRIGQNLFRQIVTGSVNARRELRVGAGGIKGRDERSGVYRIGNSGRQLDGGGIVSTDGTVCVGCIGEKVSWLS